MAQRRGQGLVEEVRLVRQAIPGRVDTLDLQASLDIRDSPEFLATVASAVTLASVATVASLERVDTLATPESVVTQVTPARADIRDSRDSGSAGMVWAIPAKP